MGLCPFYGLENGGLSRQNDLPKSQRNFKVKQRLEWRPHDLSTALPPPHVHDSFPSICYPLSVLLTALRGLAPFPLFLEAPTGSWVLVQVTFPPGMLSFQQLLGPP